MPTQPIDAVKMYADLIRYKKEEIERAILEIEELAVKLAQAARYASQS